MRHNIPIMPERVYNLLNDHMGASDLHEMYNFFDTWHEEDGNARIWRAIIDVCMSTLDMTNSRALITARAFYDFVFAMTEDTKYARRSSFLREVAVALEEAYAG